MAKFDQASPEAQKALFQALVKEITIHKDHVEMKIFVGKRFEEGLSSTSSRENKENGGTTENLKPALVQQAEGSPECQPWLGNQVGIRTPFPDVQVIEINIGDLLHIRKPRSQPPSRIQTGALPIYN